MLSTPATTSNRRILIAAIGLTAIVLSSGCSWFNKRGNGYAQNPRPLEVPPDLVVATTTASGGSYLASAATANIASFQVAGTKDQVFRLVAAALPKIGGVKVNSQSQGLGLFDVSMAGANILVRVTEQDGQSVVSAVDARGQSASSETISGLVNQIKNQISR